MPQDLSDLLKHVVPNRMTALIVNLLEVIDIKGHYADITTRDSIPLLPAYFEASPVEQASKRVSLREFDHHATLALFLPLYGESYEQFTQLSAIQIEFPHDVPQSFLIGTGLNDRIDDLFVRFITHPTLLLIVELKYFLLI